jgi:predicted ATPase/DNA-binding SARP family transcriptional activator/predicted negative regulator of RcsB-dependent stress response
MLEIRLLGKFEVCGDGRPVELPLWAAQALLAYLLLNAGMEQRREQVAGLIWPDMSDAKAKDNLRHTLWVIRKALGNRDYLLTDDLAVSFNTTLDYWLDTALLDRKTTGEESADDLITIVSAYVGGLLPGFYDDWIVLERERLQAVFERKMALLLDKLVEAQRWPEVLDWGERWIALGHVPEPAYRALMAAHAGLGDMASVATIYQRCVEALQTELGVEPAAQTRTLYERLQREATKRVIDVTLAVEEPRHNLPAQPSRFIGRERELAEIDQLLIDPACRLLTLVGAGGMGKTRLALEVAQRNLENFSAGVWLTELAPIDRDESVAPAVAGAIGVQAQPPRSLTDTIIDALQTRVLLLVIDNCEHVLNGAAELVAKILERCPDTKILTTSREPLHIAGEHLYTVPGLLLPEKDIIAEQLNEVDAVRLFVERASAVRTGFALDAHNTADVIAICRALDGMPLAIELAAARIRALSPHEITQRVGQQLRLLTSSQRADVPHHQTLQATIAWSYDLLTEAERTIFNRLSVFHGGCTLEAAERVCAGDGIEPNDVLDLLTSLVDKSMVMADTSAEGASRYRVLETLRQYGRERLIESGQENAVCRFHAEYYTELAELLEPRLIGPDEVIWLDCLLAEEDNLLAAMSWSVSQSDGVYAMRLGGALILFIGGRSYRRREHLDRLKAALSKIGTIPPVIMAKALSTIGLIQWHFGEYAETAEAYLKGLGYAQQTSDRLCLARALSDAGVGELCLGHHDTARPYLIEAIEMARELDDLWTLEAMTFLAEIEPRAEARDLLEEFLLHSRQQKSSTQIGYACFRLANFLLDDGDLAGAESLFEESLRQFKDPSGRSIDARSLASIAILRGNYDKALTLLQISHDLCRKSFGPLDLAGTLLMMGTLAYHLTNYDEAGSRYQESYSIYQGQSHQEGVAYVLKQRALLARDMNDLEQAWEFSAKSLHTYQLLNRRESACSILAVQGSIAYRKGSLAHAIELFQQSLKDMSESRDRILLVTVIEWMGIASVSHGDHNHVASLLAFAEAQRSQMGVILPPPEQPYHDEAIRILHETLDEETLTQAWQAGQAMTLEEAVAEALEPKEYHPERSEGSLAIK